ncbi:MAG TPA: hypothetical protein VHE57_15295 [Mycobacteriales bacterium]|nr:hypothetical protein [Mycobacteriales bacterium]
MRTRRLTVTGAVIGLVGLALLLFESLRSITGDHVLSSTAQVLMWIGFGALALGGILLVVDAWSEASDG